MKNFSGYKKTAHFVCLLTFLLTTPSAHADNRQENYLDMQLEDLLTLEVTTASKKKQSLHEVATAIFVITQEDIRRSGVTSIPEALRMAPGIQVARMDSNKWAISSRGFNSQFANKLLVMIDGRSVYTPSFSGVYWDAQDTMLEDIDRIEVIRGPGATVWGANAVNGVINIITKHASDTQGGLLVAGGGNQEKALASIRYGLENSEDTYSRFYLKYNDRDGSRNVSSNEDNSDTWQTARGGFRIDTQQSNNDELSFQGDIYHNDENQSINLWKDPTDPNNAVFAPFYLATNVSDAVESSGWNVMAKWQHTINDDASTNLQVYFDQTDRDEGFLRQQHDTFDIDFQHQFVVAKNHDIIWGLGYRNIRADYENTFMVSFLPATQNLDLYSAFIQDEIELIDNTLRLTIGSKFENNEFTGTEIQPSVRLLWLANKQNTFWASVSRAVRTPSLLEKTSSTVGSIVPVPPTFSPSVLRVLGNQSITSEEVIAYESGYRFQPRENLSFDLALFYNAYDDTIVFETPPPTPLPVGIIFDNTGSGHSHGLELSIDWRVLEWWRLQSNYSYLKVSGFLGTTADPDGVNSINENSSPSNQFSVRSLMDINEKVSFDTWIYYVGKIKQSSFSQNTSIDAYTSVNIRLAWHPQENLELSLAGHNLLDNNHAEFIGEIILPQTEIHRSVYAQIRWNF